MALGRKTGGRVAGTPNKATATAKQAFQLAFEEIGGPKALATWARDNQTDFYKLFSKLIPQDVNANISTHEDALKALG
jgi:hypothetical protein